MFFSGMGICVLEEGFCELEADGKGCIFIT